MGFPIRLSAITGCLAALTALVVTPAAPAQPAYVISTFAGQNSPPGYVDGPGNVARFSGPSGVVVDAAGNIFVADTGNVVVRKIAPGGMVSTFAGKAGEYGRSDGANGRLASPGHLAIDGAGNLYVVENAFSGAVRKLSPAGVLSTLAGGTGNPQDGPVNWGGFERPHGIAVDATGGVFVSDVDGPTIRKVISAGLITTVAGASAGAGTVDITDGPGAVARFNRPAGMALDAAGNLFIADSRNHTIRRMTRDGVVSTYAGVPRGSGAQDGSSTTALFNVPVAVAVDAAGNVFVAELGSHTLRKITPLGVVSTVAGLANFHGGDDGTGSAARFTSPSAIAVDVNGDLIVADAGNNTIRRVTSTGVVTTIAGRASAGSTDGSAEAARFLRPENIAADAAGNLFVTDGTHTVRKVTPVGAVTTLAGKAGFAAAVDGPGADARFRDPRGLAVDADGNVYVADYDNHTIRKISPAGVVTTLAGLAGAAGSTDGVGAAARFRRPNAVAVDGAGNVFVADLLNNRIRKITPGGVVTTLAGSGTPGHADGVGAAASFYFPFAIAAARDGTLYVVNDEAIIRRITPDGTVTTYAGRERSFGTEDGPRAEARFNRIAGLALDAAGNLFLADQGKLRVITAQGRVVTLAGRSGSYGLADGIGGAARFASPAGIAVDAAGNLYVADVADAVIRKGTPSLTAVAPPIITNPLADDRKAVAGDNVTYRLLAAGSEPLAYQWFKDNAPIAGANAATLTLSAVSTAADGNYSVSVANAAGLETKQAGRLAVYTPTLTSFSLRREVSRGAFLWSIAAGNARLVTVGTDGTIFTSTDGRTWTARNSGTREWLVGVTFGANQFVAVGDHGTILTSPDGVTWTRAADSATTQRLNNVTYGAGKFVAVGEGGAIVTSTDGKTWTARASGVSTWLRGVAYNPSQNYFAVSGQDGVLRTSADAVNWVSDPVVNVTGDLEAIVPLANHATFVSIGEDGLILRLARYRFSEWWDPGNGYYSWNWDETTARPNVRLRGIAEGANAIFAMGENGVLLSAPDTSGPWATLATGTTANLVSGVFFGNSLYVVGENETILQSEPIYNSRLINISTRGQVTAARSMISGFVVTGAAPKQVLLRAAGPSLAGFGVEGALAAPTLTLFDGAQRTLTINSGWSTAPDSVAAAAATTRVGAFAFAPNSNDAALLVTLVPGAYTVQASTATGSGVALIEAYDADPISNEGSRAINISTRGFAGTGTDKLIAGFVINGTASRRMLIRAVGPSLAPFGVTGTLAQPQLQLFNGGALQQTAGAWSTQANAGEIRSAGIMAGAFALEENSTDAALVTTLRPGAWTVQVSGLNDTTGTVLLEVYDLP